MNKVSLWLKANKLTLNTMKTKFMLFVPKNKRVNTDTVKLYIDGSEIEQTKIQKFLGVIINSQLDWKHHINYICTKIAKAIGIINKIKYYIGTKAKRTLYCSLVLPYINYCNAVWASTYYTKLDKVFKLQKRVIRIIASVGYLSHTKPLFSKYRILSVFELNKLQIGMLMFKCLKLKTTLPQFLRNYFTFNSDIHSYNTRGAGGIHIIQARTNLRKFSFRYSGPHLWNSLAQYLTKTESIYQFRAKYIHYLTNTETISN